MDDAKTGKVVPSRRQVAALTNRDAGERCHKTHGATRNPFGDSSAQDFAVEDLSHWYIRLVRRRFWLEKTSPDKLAAYTVLHHALRSWLGLAAPAMPFLTETIYREA